MLDRVYEVTEGASWRDVASGSKGTFFLLPFPFFDTMVKNNGCGDKWVGRQENGVKVAFIMLF
jgi:hypothetical protein